MKQLNIDFKNISKHQKKNDAKKGKRKAGKFVMQKQQWCMCIVGTSAMQICCGCIEGEMQKQMPWQCDVNKRCRHGHSWHDPFTEDVDAKKDEA